MPLGVEAPEFGDGLGEWRVGDLPGHGHGLRSVVAHDDVGLLAVGHVPITIKGAISQQAERKRLIRDRSADKAEKIPERRPDGRCLVVVPGNAHRQLAEEDALGFRVFGKIEFYLDRGEGACPR